MSSATSCLGWLRIFQFVSCFLKSHFANVSRASMRGLLYEGNSCSIAKVIISRDRGEKSSLRRYVGRRFLLIPEIIICGTL
jgi:hypothetical protein